MISDSPSSPSSTRQRLERGEPIRKRHVAFVLTLVVFGLSFYLAQDRTRTEELRHLGAEYFNVAQALVDGRGYADPFAEATGPTAWMPPLYTVVLAGLLLALKTKNAVAIAALVLQNLILVGVGTAIYAVVRDAAQRLSGLVAVGAYVVWLVAFRYWFFILTTDICMIAGLVTLMLLALAGWIRDGRLRAWQWGLLGGAATLVSPVLASAWGALALAAFLRTAQPARSWAVAAVIASAIALPWSMRNAATFGKFIPTKSNVGYELYLANVVDGDGVYDNQSMLRHPYHFLPERFEYTRLGEVGFVASGMQRFREALASDPAAYLRRVGNRWLAATVLYAPSERELDGPGVRVVQRLIFALPLLLLSSAVWLRSRHRPLLLVCGAFLALALAPYVIIAFYSRYVVPLTPVLIVIAFLSADTWAQRFRARIPNL
jgi:hypothetical protein